MGFKDILLQLGSYPEPTPPEAIDQAVAFVAAAGGALSALAVHVDIRAPRNRVANLLIGLNKLCEAEEEKSLHAARAILADFSTKAGAAGLLGQALLGQANVYGVGDYVAARARTRDLCLVPTDDYLDGQRSVAEAVVFGSGRPVLVFRPGRVDLPAKLDVVTLAWDGSRAAARAMADALPLLRRAGTVKVVTVINEKPDAEHGIGDPAVRHLAAHVSTRSRKSATPAAERSARF